MADGSEGSFAGVPKSLGEVRANKAESAAKWTPRDALISLLRDIDEGKVKPDALIVAYREMVGDDKTSSHYVAAVPNVHVGLGLLSYAQHQIARYAE